MCCVSAIELPMNMNKPKMIENSALIFENMSVVFINFKKLKFVQIFGLSLWLHFGPHNVYFFEFNFQFPIDG
jgi:hypothetical protein